ncbi:MAG: SurA N-terminal domain-containing protein [Syntrophales bacterium]|nr:SurA N-terminal domain-containing protein [Syntrophales bacterium]
MLQLMRKHARNWLMKVVLGIIIVVFVFYFGSMRGDQETETIAMVDGSRIAYAEFRKQYESLLDFYRQRYGDYLTDDLIKQINPKQQAFDSTISQAIILSKADELKLDVSDDELKFSILSYPAFQKNGAFNNDLYQRALRYQRMTPENFEAIQRRDLKIGKVERLIRESAKVSEQEAYEIFRLQNRKVNVNFIKIATDTVKVNEDPSEETLKAYLEKHGEEFRIPQMATVEYIVFKGESFTETAVISDEEIQAYYDYHEDEFTDNGKVNPLSKVRGDIISKLKSIKGVDAAFEKATTAHDTIYQEENFEKYAKEQGLEIGTSKLFRNIPLSGEFKGIQDLGEYVFGLQEGDLGRVFSDNKGSYVFRLVSLKPSHIPELQKVLKEVKDSYAQSSAIQAAQKKAEDILSRLKSGADMAKLSRKEGLKMAETGLFMPGPEIPQIGSSPDIEGALLEISRENPYPDRTFFVDGSYIVMMLIGEGTLDEKEWMAKKDSTKEFLLRQKGESYFLAWLEGTREDMISTGRLKILRNVEDL